MMTLHDAIREARAGKSLVVRCPAHDDHSPSVSVGPGRGGGVLIRCHAGCLTKSVLSAVGLDWKDICAAKEQMESEACGTFVVHKDSFLDDDDRRRKRATWPPLLRPTSGDLDAIARIRGLGRAGLQLAVDRGVLCIAANYRGHRSWVVTDPTRVCAQARRLDGMKFETKHGPVKAITFPGSLAGWPVGLGGLSSQIRIVLLTEGGPDILAAHHFIACEERQRDAAGVAILGAGIGICQEALAEFMGRRVRIAQHADKPGEKAALCWAHQLQPYVAQVDGMRFNGLRQHDGSPVEDLNDFGRLHPDDFEQHRWTWRILP